MYELWVGLELLSVLLLFILGWIAGSKAAGLLYAGTAERLRRKTRSLLIWAGVVAVCAAGALTSIWRFYDSFGLYFWQDKVMLHAPLLAVPVLAVLLAAVPKLFVLFRAAKGGSGPMDAGLRERASNPLLVVPFRTVPLAAAAVLYLALVPEVPLRPLEAALPPLVVLLAASALWLLHGSRSRHAAREDAVLPRRWKRALGKLGMLAALGAACALLLYSARQSSLISDRIDMASGPADFGGGAVLAHAGHGAVTAAAAEAAVSVTELTGPRAETPDRTFTLTAEHASVKLASGKTEDAWTYNGQIPGPELRVKQGELVEVTLLNKDIDEGVTIHWHGLDVPNAEDGVAGVTQDAVIPGQKHVYRFRAEQTGTYWYHSHQVSSEAVSKGLFGTLIVEPRTASEDGAETKDITVITHVWDGIGFAVGDSDVTKRVAVAPGTSVRLRLINTDDWVLQRYTLIGAPFKVAAIDGTDLNEPGELRDTALELTTGGRYDVVFTMPDRPVYLAVGGGRLPGLFMSPDGGGELPAVPAKLPVFDPLHYGKPAPTPFDASSPFDREFTMVLDNRLGFYNGTFGQQYTINGAVFPDTPMFMVKEGDLVKTTFVNRGMVEHPMHLHGHHLLVLSRNGEAASGSPWWTDTLSVKPGETYEAAFLADNSGLWMDHCHNLSHAAMGMSMHLMYEGVDTPFTVGRESVNHPE
ncbi:multicopper oxidase family protein [Paenibacillus humicola]|uniref:multicopper oxidase family protein n=1 Tax=Paenibacillus humicola TaxID=3110540 RepID=UPI00237B8C1A|nr:multicopper oxidase family protein [Paenibacillus humicola]